MTGLLRSWRIPALLAGAFATLLVAASPAWAADVVLGPDGFEPEAVTVEPGEQILWVNDTTAPQTIIGEDGSWDSGPLAPGETFSVDLRTTGPVAYGTEDGVHLGQIEVRAATPTADVPDEQRGQAAATMPRTGASPGSAALLAVALLAVGGACLLAAPRPGSRST